MTKKNFITAGLIIAAIVVLAISGYFSAIPKISDQANFAPELQIASKNFDFDNVSYGQILEKKFEITNSGNQNLEILRLATSCGCTTATISQNQIAPGQSVELKVRYDTGAMTGAHAKGKQERIIFIKSNDPRNPQTEVRIYANVK